MTTTPLHSLPPLSCSSCHPSPCTSCYSLPLTESYEDSRRQRDYDLKVLVKACWYVCYVCPPGCSVLFLFVSVCWTVRPCVCPSLSVRLSGHLCRPSIERSAASPSLFIRPSGCLSISACRSGLVCSSVRPAVLHPLAFLGE